MISRPLLAAFLPQRTPVGHLTGQRWSLLLYSLHIASRRLSLSAPNTTTPPLDTESTLHARGRSPRRMSQAHSPMSCPLQVTPLPCKFCLPAGFFNNVLYPFLSSSGFLISDPWSHDPIPGLWVPSLPTGSETWLVTFPPTKLSYLQREVILRSERLGRLWPRPGWWSECGHSRSCPSSSDIDHVAVQTVQLPRVLLWWKQEVSAGADPILIHIQVF